MSYHDDRQRHLIESLSLIQASTICHGVSSIMQSATREASKVKKMGVIMANAEDDPQKKKE